MLLDLPINDKTINRLTNINESISERLLGFRLIQNNMRGQGIKITWLKNEQSNILNIYLPLLQNIDKIGKYS